MSERIRLSEVEWRRIPDIFKDQNYLLFEGTIEMADINQGSLGDCYFLASAAALSEYPNLIYHMFRTKKISENGLYEIVFFIDGKFQLVLIDDYLPVNKKNGTIAYARPNKNELWVCLLEKAWAKINGGYSNIIKGWMRHVLQTFTGFGSQSFTHTKVKPEKLWKAISFAHKNNCIMSSSSRKSVESKGLVNSHAYTLIGTYEITHKGKKVKLCKMRNTWGYKEWKGDWSDESPLWGEEEKAQVNFQAKDDGSFWISFNDYFKNFIVTDICYLLHNSHSKSFLITDANQEIRKGQVFNLYLEEEGLFSVNLIRKMWRFHRELKNNIIPSFVILAGYDPNSDEKEFITSFKGVSDSYEDISITKKLKKGFYIIYCYHDYEHSTVKEKEYVIKIDSTAVFKYKKMKSDEPENGFPLLKKITTLSVLKAKGAEATSKEKVSYVSDYKESGIGHKLLYNPTDEYQKYTDGPKLENMFMLSPYNKNEKFDYYVPPKGYNIILSMVYDSKVEASNKFTSNVTSFEKPEDYELNEINIEEYANASVESEVIPSIKEYYDRTSMSLEEAQKKLQFEVLDMSEMTLTKIESEDPELVKLLTSIPAVDNDKDLSWVSKKYASGKKFVGQVNKNLKKEGRGYLSDKVQYFVGYFKNDLQNGKGMQYDSKKNKVIYEGNFKNGVRDGEGKMFFQNGDSYEGNFVNDVRQGHGVYHFKSGATWEGEFTEDKMNGEGEFTGANGKKKTVKYNMGVLVK